MKKHFELKNKFNNFEILKLHNLSYLIIQKHFEFRKKSSTLKLFY